MPSKLTGIMAAGKPVVATVRAGPAGIITPPGDCQAFAQAITSLADRPQLRETIGRAARRIAEREFDKEVILQRINQEMIRLVGS